jgi:hypothetical protein
MPDNVIERREGYVDIHRELGSHNESINGMKNQLKDFGSDMKEVRKDVTELKVGHTEIGTKLDTLIDMNGKFVEEQAAENKKNQRMRWTMKWFAAAVMSLPACKLLLPSKVYAKLLALISF